MWLCELDLIQSVGLTRDGEGSYKRAIDYLVPRIPHSTVGDVDSSEIEHVLLHLEHSYLGSGQQDVAWEATNINVSPLPCCKTGNITVRINKYNMPMLEVYLTWSVSLNTLYWEENALIHWSFLWCCNVLLMQNRPVIYLLVCYFQFSVKSMRNLPVKSVLLCHVV